MNEEERLKINCARMKGLLITSLTNQIISLGRFLPNQEVIVLSCYDMKMTALLREVGTTESWSFRTYGFTTSWLFMTKYLDRSTSEIKVTEAMEYFVDWYLKLGHDDDT